MATKRQITRAEYNKLSKYQIDYASYIVKLLAVSNMSAEARKILKSMQKDVISAVVKSGGLHYLLR